MTFLYYLVFSIFALKGCDIYSPTCTDFPMLDGKGDFRLDGTAVLFGPGLTLSYGITDNLFVQADAYYTSERSANRYYGLISSGWYNNYDNKIVELFGGVSYGHGSVWSVDRDSHRLGDYGTCFLQGNYGWKGLANSHIDVALGAKLGYYCAFLREYIYHYDHPTSSIKGICNALFLEPTVDFRFGWEKLKFNVTAGYNFHQAINYSNKTEMCNHLCMELSLNYHFKSANR